MNSTTQGWIFLRGLSRSQGHWLDFGNIFESALPNHKVFYIDMPGVGDTPPAKKNTISSYTDCLREQFIKTQSECVQWNILAISLGGMIALDWITRFQDDFKNTVIINTSSWNSGKKRTSFDTLLKLIKSKILYSTIYEQELHILKAITFLNDEELKNKAKLLSEVSQNCPISIAVSLGQLQAAATFKLKRGPQTNTRPLFLASKQDPLTPYTHSINLAKLLNGKVELHPLAGHDLPLEDPNWVIDKIKSFL